MPHVIVKMWPGKSEEQKRELVDLITRDLMATLKSSDASISVAIEEVDRDDWFEQVYRPDIEPHLDRLYKKPGYGPPDP
jgi:4-oxalocrotonate tautomerase